MESKVIRFVCAECRKPFGPPVNPQFVEVSGCEVCPRCEPLPWLDATDEALLRRQYGS